LARPAPLVPLAPFGVVAEAEALALAPVEGVVEELPQPASSSAAREAANSSAAAGVAGLLRCMDLL
jgi:hypothetical protein